MLLNPSLYSISLSKIRASASLRRSTRISLNHSPRLTAQRHGSLAGPAWGFRSRASWWSSWAERYGWRAQNHAAHVSISTYRYGPADAGRMWRQISYARTGEAGVYYWWMTTPPPAEFSNGSFACTALT